MTQKLVIGLEMSSNRIGLIIPSSNTTMEFEFWRLVPPGITVHTGRVSLVNVDVESLERMAEEVVKEVEKLSTAEVGVVVYGCTSGSLLKGLGWERDLREKIERVAGVKAVTTAGAVVDALRALGVKRVAVATPYIEEINVRERMFLESSGFTVARIKGLGIVKNADIGKQPPEVAYRLALEVVRGIDVDAVFISCTNFRTLEIIDPLESRLGIPVVSSNTASAWAALRALGVKERVNIGGKLLRELL